MKLAIIGSRTFNDYEKFLDIIEKFTPGHDQIDEIISGGAKGADSLAEHYADYWSIKTKIIKPDWNKYGKSAGFRRNSLIIDSCDAVLAFWDGKSPGTLDALIKAREAKKITITAYV